MPSNACDRSKMPAIMPPINSKRGHFGFPNGLGSLDPVSYPYSTEHIQNIFNRILFLASTKLYTPFNPIRDQTGFSVETTIV
jgi:hypothetical protein